MAARVLDLVEDEPGISTTWLDLHELIPSPANRLTMRKLVAAMIHHKIDRLLTFNDTDFKRFTEISVESPLSLASP